MLGIDIMLDIMLDIEVDIKELILVIDWEVVIKSHNSFIIILILLRVIHHLLSFYFDSNY